MIDKKNYDRIVVDSYDRMEEIIQWYKSNAGWIDNIPFHAPIPSAIVVLVEEKIEFLYEPVGDKFKFHVWFDGISCPVETFLYDPATKSISEWRSIKTSNEGKNMMIRKLLTVDRTSYKESIKFHSLMCFAAHYRNVVEVSGQRRNSLSKSQARRMSRKSGKEVSLFSTVYKLANIEEKDRIEADRPYIKRGYTKPTQEVSVRGFYRTTKTGRRVWVRPFTKYKGADKNGGTTYKV